METQVSGSGTGIFGHNVTLSGTYVAGRDITITETKIFRSKPEFSAISLEPYNRKNYSSPRFTQQLLARLREKKLILVGGSYGFDKGAFVRHLASLLVEDLKGLTAKEWLYTSDYYSVFSQIYEEGTPSVFILNQIVPQHVNYNVARLISMAEQKGHYILISTDSAVETWKLADNIVKDYWFDIPSSGLYEESFLTDLLCEYFNGNKDQLKMTRGAGSFINPDTTLLFGLTTREVAVQLQVPHKIDLFYKLLVQQREVLSEETMANILDAITRDSGEETVKQWFHSLRELEKVVALGALLFDGLYDDQFFSAIRYVVNDHWHLRNSQLKVMDYCDLENLLNFYKLEIVDKDTKILKSKFPGQRIDLLRTIWQSHRRHIIMALPTLVNMIHHSVDEPNSDWELFGNDKRKERLHTVISEILSDIGLMSLPAVETTLIELASANHVEVQAVAAKAIARWRKNDNGSATFAVLDNWQKGTRARSLLSSILEKRNAVQAQGEAAEISQANKKIDAMTFSRSYIRATIGLTLGYTAQYDNPGNLSDQIIQLLRQLTNDADQLVRQRLMEVTLPQIISQHFIQLKGLLLEWTSHADLIFSIARGLANAYNNSPGELLKLIQSWIEHCWQNKTSMGIAGPHSEADKVLLTVIMTLGEIEYSDAYPAFDINAGFRILTQLQMEWPQKKFRIILLILVQRQIKVNFNKYQSHIRLLLTNFSLEEQDDVIESLLQLYADQRENMSDGDFYLSWRNKYFPIWIDQHRPITEVEQILFEWLYIGDEITQQVAAKAFAKFTDVYEYQEQRMIEEIREKRKKALEPVTQSAPKPNFITRIQPSLLVRAALFFSDVPSGNNIKGILQNIFPAIFSANLAEKHYDIIAENWNYKGGDFVTLGGYLKKTFKMYSTVRTWVVVIGFVFFFGMVILLMRR